MRVTLLLSLFALNLMASDFHFLEVKNLYIPEGFDSNDKAEVVIESIVPNICFSAPKTTAINIGKKIYVTLTAEYVKTREKCDAGRPTFIVAATMEHALKKGTYTVIVNAGTEFETKGKLKIKEATTLAADDYHYANVESVIVNEKTGIVTMKGFNPSYCFEKIEPILSDNKKDVVNILPVMTKVSELCPMKLVPFLWTVNLNDHALNVNKDKFLIHVRSMLGNSVNVMYNRSEK